MKANEQEGDIADDLAENVEALRVEIQRANKRMDELRARLPEPEEKISPIARLTRALQEQAAKREAARGGG